MKIASGQDKQMCVKSPCVVGNLQAATTYEITVKAFTNAGEGPASDVVEVVTDSARKSFTQGGVSQRSQVELNS